MAFTILYIPIGNVDELATLRPDMLDRIMEL